MKRKITAIATTITAILLLVSAAALAYGHTWVKMSEAHVSDQFGNSAVQCVWVCRAYNHGNHTTVTQGYASCPYPY